VALLEHRHLVVELLGRRLDDTVVVRMIARRSNAVIDEDRERRPAPEAFEKAEQPET
jgi:hypothetical protein